jgi:hypothetical protein
VATSTSTTTSAKSESSNVALIMIANTPPGRPPSDHGA